jgi:hypothetical protein
MGRSRDSVPVSLNGAGARSSIRRSSSSRLQMSILDVSVQFPSGATYRDRDRSLQEGLPWTLQPGEAKHVTLPAPALFKAWNYGEPGRAAASIHGVAQLGNGKSATSNSLVMLPP